MFVTRLCWNDQKWQCPSGAAKGLENGTFYSKHGFGHEEWLFRNGWELGGWRYGFIQGLNKGRNARIKQLPLDLTIYTIDDQKQRRYVASINELEMLSDQGAEDALKAFKANGWFKTMLREVNDLGADTEAMRGETIPWHIFNVRYRTENATFYDDLPLVPKDHPIQGLPRYQLSHIDEVVDTQKGMGSGRRSRSARTVMPGTTAVSRNGSVPTTIDPVHNRMQERLEAELKKEHPGKRIVLEENFVDAKVEDKDTIWLYEIKSDRRPLSVLRQAIGQLLEYGFYNPSASKRIVLTAVGRVAMEKADSVYLDALHKSFGLRIHYRVISGD